jgi:hypothetical protein
MRLLTSQMAQRNDDSRDGSQPPLQNDDALCKYHGKRCLNLRAVKATGALHNLCDQHRKNANDTQRKSQYIKRMKLKANSGKSVRLTDDPPCRGKSADTWRCTYSKGRNCKSVRAIKTNGEYHRLCDYHAKQAKVHRDRSLKKKRGGLDSMSHRTFGTSATVTDQEFQWIGGTQAREQCGAMAPHALGHLTLGAKSFATNKDTVDLVLGNIQPREPLCGLMVNLHDAELRFPRPRLPPWLPDFVDDVYASLDK